MAAILGLNCKLYRNTATATPWESPTWVEIGNVKDLTSSLEAGEADASVRAGNGWRQRLPTLFDGTIDFQMVWDTEDANFEAIKDAFFGRTLIDILANSGDITVGDSEGLRAEMSVLNFTINQPLEDVVTVDVSIAPGYGSNAPVWLETTNP